MKFGSTRPALREDWSGRNWAWRSLAKCERIAAWFYYLFGSVALFRLLIEAVAVVALAVTILGVYSEFQQRRIDRGVRIATLFAQIAETHALPHGRGLSALKASVEVLVREGVPMHGINLSATHLRRANLAGADLLNADLSRAILADAELEGANLFKATLVKTMFDGAKLIRANLTDADLRGANLFSANLSGASLALADLAGAMLYGATFSGTNLSGADLSKARGLKQQQLDDACATPNSRPALPPSFNWKDRPCPSGTLVTVVEGR